MILPKAVVFDFDGVIVDTERLHYRAFQEILEPLGLGYSWDEYTRVYMGFDDRDAFREVCRMSRRELTEEDLRDWIQQKAEAFESIVQDDSLEPFPGVGALLEALQTAGVPVAICSGALERDIRPILDRFGWREYFAHIITADQVQRSKPDPEGYQMAMHALGIARHDACNCFAIEDTPAGIMSAKAAGMRVLAVTNSYSSDQLTGADKVVESLANTGRNPLERVALAQPS
jgi:beta-phosphoglucomutase